jgi:hypothetical protein
LLIPILDQHVHVSISSILLLLVEVVIINTFFLELLELPKSVLLSLSEFRICFPDDDNRWHILLLFKYF